MRALTCRPFSSPACVPNRTGQRSPSNRVRAKNACCACQARDTASSSSTTASSNDSPLQLTRRGLALSLPLTVLLGAASASRAEEAVSSSPAAASSSTSSSSPSPELQLFYDNDYELQIPSNFNYLDTPVVVAERGPQPERSPVLARFEPTSPGQPGAITILERRAQDFKQTLFQVADITQLGDPIAVAKLVLPRGSTLLAASTQIVEQPAKQTPVGPVEIPPQTYYTYEFTANTGVHVAMTVSAKRGTVYLCGASTTAEAWPQSGSVFNRVVKSFRMRSQPSIS